MKQTASRDKLSLVDALVSAFCLIALPLLVHLSGAALHGFRLYDDHDALQGLRNIANNGFINAVKNQVLYDQMLFNRFRPVFWFQRYAQLSIAKQNFSALIYFTGVLGGATSLLIYIAGRKLRLSVPIAAAVVAIAMVGEYSTVWWRLGTGETLSMLCLVASLCFAFLSNESAGHRKKLWLCAALGMWFISVLSKESFLFFIPGLVGFKILHEGIGAPSRPFKDAFLDNWKFILACVVVAGGYTVFLKAFILTTAGSYGSNYLPGSYRDLFTAAGAIFWSGFGATLLAIYVCGFLGVISYSSLNGADPASGKSRIRLALNTPTTTFLIWLAVALPQLALYSKVSLRDRYHYPTALATALAIGLLTNGASVSKVLLRWPAIILVAALFLFGSAFQMVKAFLRAGSDHDLYIRSINSLFLSKHELVSCLIVLGAAAAVLTIVRVRDSLSKSAALTSILLLAMIQLFSNGLVATRELQSFRNDGSNTAEFFTQIENLSERADLIYVAGDLAWHYQWLLSIHLYLEDVLHRANVKSVPFELSREYAAGDRIAVGDFKARFPAYVPNRDMRPKAVIVTGALNQFLASNSWFIPEQYREIPGLRFNLFVAK